MSVKIAYPDVLANAQTVTVSDAEDSDFPASNLIDSSKALISRLNTAASEYAYREYDLGSGNSRSVDHVAIGRADLLKSSGVSCVNIRGSRQPRNLISSMLNVYAHFDASDLSTITKDSDRKVSAWSSKVTNSSANRLNSTSGSWSANRCSLTDTAIPNPISNDVDAWVLIEDTSVSNSHILSQLITVTSAIQYTYEVYARRVFGTRDIQLTFTTGFPSNSYANFDLDSGAVDTTGAGLDSASITDVGSGWFKCTIIATASSSTNGDVRMLMLSAGSQVYTGDGESSVGLFNPRAYRTTGQNHSADQSTDSAKPLLSRADNLENRYIYSEDVWDNTTYWTPSNCTVVGNRITASAGTSQVKLAATAALLGLGAIGETLRVRVEAEYLTHQYLMIHDFAGSNHNGATFDLVNGTIDGEVNISNASMTARSAGGWIIEFELTQSDISTANAPYIQFAMVQTADDVPGPGSYTWTGSEAVILHNIQVCSTDADNVYLATSGIAQYRGVNGLPTLIFDGSNDVIFTAALSDDLRAANHIFVVVEFWDAGTDVGIFDGGSASNNHYLGIDSSDQFEIDAGSSLTTSAFAVTGTRYVLEAKFNTTNSRLYIDGTQEQTGNAGSEQLNYLLMGRRANGTDFWLGRICELVVIDGIAPDSQQEKIQQYLLDKWKTSPLAQQNNLQNTTLQGPASQDIIKSFSDSTAYRYFTIDYSLAPGATSKIPHADLFIGQAYDFGERAPGPTYKSPTYVEVAAGRVVASSSAQFRSRSGRQPNVFTLNWKVVGSEVDEFHTKIAQYRDVYPFFVYTTDDSQLLSEYEVIKCWLEDFSVDSESALSDVHTISATFREDVSP